MEYSLYPGCLIATEQYAYEISAVSVLNRLGIGVSHAVEGTSCCGFPMRSLSSELWLYLAARNLAIYGSKYSGGMLCLCNGCYGSIVEARHWLSDGEVRYKASRLLSLEGLELSGDVAIKHLLEVLHDEVGPGRLEGYVQNPLEGLRVAVHVGCHLLRPSAVVRVDDHERPVKLANLVRALGAEVVHYPDELECCGAGLLLLKPEGAMSLACTKLRSIKELGADLLVTICPACHKMLDGKQEAIARLTGADVHIPVMYYTQLLGLSMGIPEESLGLALNLSPVERIIERIT